MALPFRAVLVDYEEPPPDWVEGELADHGIEWVARQHRTSEAALVLSRNADVVTIQSARPLLNQAVIEGLEQCRGIVRLGTGYDSVDLATASRRGIPVCNVPAYCTDDVADHALALLVDLARHVTWYHCLIRSGNWAGTGFPTRYRIKGRTLGIIGFGRIGRALAERVSGFGMTLLAYDPYVDAETIARYRAKKVSLEDLLGRADFISLHPPLTDETYHMLSTSEFDSIKEGVSIVNTSRGSVIDEAALVEALRAGRVAGVGMDVFEGEPLSLDSPLREFDNVILTPHIAFSSAESWIDLYRDACESAVDIVQGTWPETVVNPEVEGKTAYPFRRR